MKMKKILASILALAMVLSTMGTVAFAGDAVPDLPTATVTPLLAEGLTFALNFTADEVTDEQLDYYGDWYADFELTVNTDVTFNANGEADGYLAGQYDVWDENWVSVPDRDVTLNANEPLKIMAYAAELMGAPGLQVTYKDVYNSVKDFDCGVYFSEEFLAKNPDLEVDLALKMYNPEDETEYYEIGDNYDFDIANAVARVDVESTGIRTFAADVAEVGGTYFMSLEDAIAAIGTTEGTYTINLLKDVEDDVTFTQNEGVNIVLDGNDHTFGGTIYIEGKARLKGEETLTIQNVNFEKNTDTAHDFISANSTEKDKRYAHNVTVKDCAFTATGEGEVAAMRYRQTYNMTVEGCTFDGLHSVMWTTGGEKIDITGIEAENCKNGISIGTTNNVTVTGSTIEATDDYGYGVRANADNNQGSLNVVNCEITAAAPVLVRNTTNPTYSLSVDEDSTLTSTREDGYAIVVTKTDYNEEIPTITTPEVSINISLDEDYAISSYAVIANGKGYATLADALANVGAGDVVINLLADAELDYRNESYGSVNTTSITINGNGHTLTLNQKNSDSSSIDMASDNGVFKLKDVTVKKGENPGNGAWNNHAINFKSAVNFENVTFTNAIALYADANLKNVTVNENGDYYALWITAEGQDVTINGLTVNAGRGIKIDEQYVKEGPSEVDLSIANANFTTAKKAAIVVNSEAGADITTGENIDISKVAKDSVNIVWVDGNAAGAASLVTVNGEYAVVESDYATDISVSFEQVGDGLYNIVLKGNNGDINEFVGAEFTFANNSTTANGKEMKYEISGYTDATTGEVKTVVIKADEDNNTYGLHINGSDDSIAARLSGESIIIGQVKFNGQGTINFNVVSGKVVATENDHNTEKYYDTANDTLVLTNAAIGADTTKVRDVIVNIAYNHILDGTYWNGNTQITVTLKDSFGKNVEPASKDDRQVKFEDVQEGRIVVTLEAPGFRKYVYTTMLNDEDSALVLNFWNNVKRGTDADEWAKIDNTNDAEQEKACNFLVGDIVMDYIVDEYDLAAVTSYYGMYNLTDTNKIGYDLNRDGNIDIIDVAYVLHTMGN